MARYRATLAYDGTGFLGFQKQGTGRTVQAEVEAALRAVFGQPVSVVGAGRTDAGVHATGQVIAFDAEWLHGDDALLTVLNHALPQDIALRDLAQQADFHPRYDALARAYRYDVMPTSPVRHPLMSRLAWQIAQPLDVPRMNEAASLLLGEHDFATFGRPPKGTNTVRVVYESVWRQHESLYGPVCSYSIEATAFLHHMVRRIVTMLVDVGRGWQTVTQFETAFRAASLRCAGKPAPPQGLVLVHVRYPPPGQKNERNGYRRDTAPPEVRDEG
jgi:tRNA pseudouridine38-40 synthase